MIQRGSLNRLFPLANYINCDPLSDHSKSKAQTTKVQQPCHTLPMPLAEINYSPKKPKKKNISFSSLPDGKSASRNNMYNSFGAKLYTSIMESPRWMAASKPNVF